ncbi:hypothetical protein MTR67_042941 [Solanum verrucosum]|uniref:Uncharacterized protein n=1 Tax=Solanum verrucosum TaxID=315347 RepID=A0AAF0UR02_SOLVR|nr:hypothetical protein MTR67_042941 [Solanum verrucosum]
MFEGKHGHYVAKRNEKAEKKRRNEGLRIIEFTWQVAKGSYFTFCSSLLSAEGKDQVGRKMKQSAHHREIPRSNTISPNDSEHDNAEGWCKMTMNYTEVDHLASLVRIADQLGDSPFGLVHRCLAPAFSIVVLEVIGRHGIASRNFSAMHRLLFFSTDLIISFRAQHSGTKGEVRPFGDSPCALGNPHTFISSFFSSLSLLFAT